MKTLNLPQHPCANKCTDYKGEQCKTCLVQELPSSKECDSDFLLGDVVVIIDHRSTDLFTVTEVKGDFFGDWVVMTDSKNVEWTSGTRFIRPATTAEIQANRRLTEAEQALAEVS